MWRICARNIWGHLLLYCQGVQCQYMERSEDLSLQCHRSTSYAQHGQKHACHHNFFPMSILKLVLTLLSMLTDVYAHWCLCSHRHSPVWTSLNHWWVRPICCMSMHMSIHMSIHMTTCMSMHTIFVCVCARTFSYTWTNMSMHMSTHIYVHQSVHLSMRMMPECAIAYLCVCLAQYTCSYTDMHVAQSGIRIRNFSDCLSSALLQEKSFVI